MCNWIEKVHEFHRKYKLHVSSTSELPKEKTINLRIDLIQEEVDELKAAVVEQDIVAIADALGDILYATIGGAIEYNIPIERVFDEIHRSNMTKEASDTFKLTKGKTYSPPDLKSILNTHEDHD